jgi:hypothetical protein
VGIRRALHRCLRIGGTGITPLLITHDAYGAERDWNSVAVAPTKRTLARFMPTVLVDFTFLYPLIGLFPE